MIEELLTKINSLNENFDINDINHYRLFINILYNNITILQQKNEDINQAIVMLLEKIYILNDQLQFSAKNEVLTKYLQKWMKL